MRPLRSFLSGSCPPLPGNGKRRISRVLDAYLRADPARAARQAEDLCIVLADRRYRDALPHVFPGIAGAAPVAFTASWGIPRGDLAAIRPMALPLIRNELALFPGSDLYTVVPRLFATAEALCEYGITLTDANGQTLRLGGFLPADVERKVCLGAILAAGDTRVALPEFTDDRFSFQTEEPEEEDEDGDPPPSRLADFVSALAGGQRAADALVAAGFLSAALRDTFRAVAAWRQRHPKRPRRKQLRVRPVR
jgi:hypothetical protein